MSDPEVEMASGRDPELSVRETMTWSSDTFVTVLSDSRMDFEFSVSRPLSSYRVCSLSISSIDGPVSF